jgi:cell division protein FtsN
MADRYQDRPFPAQDDYDRGGSNASGKEESDPLAELARLIGQTDPHGTIRRANLPVQPRAREPDPYDQQDPQDPYELSLETDGGPAPGPPSWIQRAARQETPPPPPPEYPSAVHPLHRYPAAPPAPEPDYDDQAPSFADADHERDLSRYDDELYGELDSGAAESQHDPAYADDAYAYQDGYDDGAEDEVPKRRGGMATVIVVLALAVLGTGGAFAYRTYMGSARSGEPPIIRADAGPTKIVPAPADGSTKVPDRMSSGDGTEKIVPREEAPVDVNARSGPRVVFPPLNGNPPATASAAPGAPSPAGSGNGTLSNGEPRKIRTFSVRGDQSDAAATPVTATPPATARTAAPAAAPRTPSAANASAANSPLSLAPQAAQPAAEPPTRVATTSPAQTAPSGGGASGAYLVQVSSQRSEADAQASYKALQGKFPAVLGSRAPVIKRADLGDKGTYYRAMVGPFGSPDEASQFCGSLKSAGGQCVVQRN